MTTTKQILQQVKKIELTTKQLVDGLIAGNYHSIFKGVGLEFSEIREYKPGDDIRSIDWNVTARYDKPYIKEFIEERDLHIYFIFDYSASSNFGNTIQKKQKAIELTATLMFSAIRNNDNVGLFLFTNRIEKFIPARKGKRHILKLITNLISFEPKNHQTDIKNTLSEISNIIKKRSILFIISDFYNQQFEKPLKILNKKNDVVAIRITDERELRIPDIGLIQLEDEESGEQILVDTSDEEFQQNYNSLINDEENRLTKLFRKQKIDTIKITTDESYIVPLKKFFKKRRERGVMK